MRCLRRSRRPKENKNFGKVIIIINIIYIIILLLLFKFNIFATDKNKTAYIYIGDSRIVDLDNKVHLSNMKDTFVVAGPTAGYSWFKVTGSKEINQIKETYKDVYTEWVYVFNLGLNDLSNIDDYKRLYLDLSKEATVYYLSINPTDELLSGIKSDDIEKFNEEIYSLTDINYINSYQYLTDVSGITFDKIANDGIKYNNETYTKLYDFIDLSIKVHEFVEDNEDRYSAFYYLYNIK